MLLFRPEHVTPILAGTKTETRRIWKRWRANVGSIHLAKTKMLSTEHFAKLRILSRRVELLGDITDAGAKSEGYASREEYLAKFREINKLTGPIEGVYVHVLEFEVVQ